MLKVWGRPYSSNVIPVIWAVNELGLKYDLMLAGGSFGKLDTDQYAKINPNRMIPAIQDGEFALWESLSIIRYLSEAYGKGSLLPCDLQAKAIADQWMEWSASKAFGPVIYLFFATVRTKPAERDEAKISKLRDEAQKKGAWSAAINAEVARGKAGGLYVDQKLIMTGNLDNMSEKELEAKMAKILDDHKNLIDVTPEGIEDKSQQA